MDKMEQGRKPDFILIPGDIHIGVLEAHLEKIKIPIHLVAGNHEDSNARKRLRNLFPADFKKNDTESDYYSFVHKGVRFIGLCNAGVGGEHLGQLCSEGIKPRGQCEWLEKQLNEKEFHKIVFAHIPPEPDGLDRDMYMSRNDSRYFNKLIEQTQPTAMFFGHKHLPTTQSKIGQTKSFVVRSCCWNMENKPLGFLHVKISNEGIETSEIITAADYKSPF
jgi:Icc-related predicted phosphoesterase